jgi:hypothetical protein
MSNELSFVGVLCTCGAVLATVHVKTKAHISLQVTRWRQPFVCSLAARQRHGRSARFVQACDISRKLRRRYFSFKGTDMDFAFSRRDFLTGSAKLGAAAAVVSSGVGVAFATNAATDAPALASAHSDVLFALGQRIGLDAAAAIGTFGSPLSVTYLDAAGSSVDALREGIELGSRAGVGCGVVCVESAMPYGSFLGTAYFSDPATGRTARVEIHSEALSHIEMIADATRSRSLQKQAIMSAPASGLYTIYAA